MIWLHVFTITKAGLHFSSWYIQKIVQSTCINIAHRIHGAGIYMLTFGVYWWDPCYHINSSTMDPSWVGDLQTLKTHWILCRHSSASAAESLVGFSRAILASSSRARPMRSNFHGKSDTKNCVYVYIQWYLMISNDIQWYLMISNDFNDIEWHQVIPMILLWKVGNQCLHPFTARAGAQIPTLHTWATGRTQLLTTIVPQIPILHHLEKKLNIMSGCFNIYEGMLWANPYPFRAQINVHIQSNLHPIHTNQSPYTYLNLSLYTLVI